MAKKFTTLPMKDGITASQVFLPKQNNFNTVFEFLVQKFPHISRSEWQERFENELILGADAKPLSIDTAYLAEQHIYYYRQLKQETIVPFEHEILFENEEFMLVDKPHFLTVSPSGQYVQQTLLTRLKQQTQTPYLSPIHRLDRETAGLILISKNPNTRGLYQQLFANKQIRKIYHAIAPFSHEKIFPVTFSARMVKGSPFCIMHIEHGEANSTTQIQILESNHTWAKYQLEPITGKQHQLRVHMNALGLPLKNDLFYPRIRRVEENFDQPLQLLAKEIQFIDPITKQPFHFTSAKNLILPRDDEPIT